MKRRIAKLLVIGLVIVVPGSLFGQISSVDSGMYEVREKVDFVTNERLKEITVLDETFNLRYSEDYKKLQWENVKLNNGVLTHHRIFGRLESGDWIPLQDKENKHTTEVEINKLKLSGNNIQKGVSFEEGAHIDVLQQDEALVIRFPRAVVTEAEGVEVIVIGSHSPFDPNKNKPKDAKRSAEVELREQLVGYKVIVDNKPNTDEFNESSKWLTMQKQEDVIQDRIMLPNNVDRNKTIYVHIQAVTNLGSTATIHGKINLNQNQEIQDCECSIVLAQFIEQVMNDSNMMSNSRKIAEQLVASIVTQVREGETPFHRELAKFELLNLIDIFNPEINVGGVNESNFHQVKNKIITAIKQKNYTQAEGVIRLIKDLGIETLYTELVGLYEQLNHEHGQKIGVNKVLGLLPMPIEGYINKMAQLEVEIEGGKVDLEVVIDGDEYEFEEYDDMSVEKISKFFGDGFENVENIDELIEILSIKKFEKKDNKYILDFKLQESNNQFDQVVKGVLSYDVNRYIGQKAEVEVKFRANQKVDIEIEIEIEIDEKNEDEIKLVQKDYSYIYKLLGEDIPHPLPDDKEELKNLLIKAGYKLDDEGDEENGENKIPYWDVGTGYKASTSNKRGSIVMYKGKLYECIQTHTSDAPNWTPDLFSVGWKEIEDKKFEVDYSDLANTPNWQVGRKYAKRDKVSEKGKIYSRIQDDAAGQASNWNPSANPAVWFYICDEKDITKEEYEKDIIIEGNSVAPRPCKANVICGKSYEKVKAPDGKVYIDGIELKVEEDIVVECVCRYEHLLPDPIVPEGGSGEGSPNYIIPETTMRLKYDLQLFGDIQNMEFEGNMSVPNEGDEILHYKVASIVIKTKNNNQRMNRIEVAQNQTACSKAFSFNLGDLTKGSYEVIIEGPIKFNAIANYESYKKELLGKQATMKIQMHYERNGERFTIEIPDIQAEYKNLIGIS